MRGFSGLAVAYDLIGYFLRLDTIEEFSKNEQKQLKDLLTTGLCTVWSLAAVRTVAAKRDPCVQPTPPFWLRKV